MAPLIIAGLVALVVVFELGLMALTRALLGVGPPPRPRAPAAYHEFEFSANVKFLLALYAIGWECDQIEWWPLGTLDHDPRHPWRVHSGSFTLGTSEVTTTARSTTTATRGE